MTKEPVSPRADEICKSLGPIAELLQAGHQNIPMFVGPEMQRAHLDLMRTWHAYLNALEAFNDAAEKHVYVDERATPGKTN